MSLFVNRISTTLTTNDQRTSGRAGKQQKRYCYLRVTSLPAWSAGSTLKTDTKDATRAHTHAYTHLICRAIPSLKAWMQRKHHHPIQWRRSILTVLIFLERKPHLRTMYNPRRTLQHWFHQKLQDKVKLISTTQRGGGKGYKTHDSVAGMHAGCRISYHITQHHLRAPGLHAS